MVDMPSGGQSESLSLGSKSSGVAQGWWCLEITRSAGALECLVMTAASITRWPLRFLCNWKCSDHTLFGQLNSYSFKFYLFLRLARVSFCFLQLKKSNKHILVGGILSKRITRQGHRNKVCTYYVFFRILTVTPSSCVYVHVCVYINTYKLHMVKIISPIPAIIHG